MEVIARKIVNENGEEIIELDLNKPWPKRAAQSYTNYMDEVERLISREKKERKASKEFITILN